MFTFGSRLLGLVRDRIMGSVFGTSPWHAAFVIGFIVPNLFRRLFGEGALAAAFVPHYARLVETDPALARRFASRCVAGLAVALAGLTLLGEAGLWLALQTDAVAGSDKASAALRMTALMLPYMPLVCGVAFLGAILQVHHRFGPAAAAPVVLNVAMITAAIGAGFLTTVSDAHEVVRAASPWSRSRCWSPASSNWRGWAGPYAHHRPAGPRRHRPARPRHVGPRPRHAADHGADGHRAGRVPDQHAL